MSVPLRALREKSDLLKQFKLMLAVQSPLQKYSRFLLTQITCISFAIPAHTKGRFAIVTNVGQGMRWTRVARLTSALHCGRRSRVVLTPRRWRQVGERNFTDDGGKQARSPGRARNKPLKPSRAGMPGDPGATVVTNACAFYHYARGCGCNGHPAFPTPLIWAKNTCTTRAYRAAGCGAVLRAGATSFRGDAQLEPESRDSGSALAHPGMTSTGLPRSQ